MQNLPHVTTILRTLGLSPDFSMVEPRVLEAARKRGVAVHSLCEAIDNGEVGTVVPDPLRGYVDGYRQWLTDCNVRVVDAEQRVTHPMLGYVGRYDLLAIVAGMRTIVDRKATASIHHGSVRLQLAAYRLAYNVPDATMNRRHAMATGSLHLRRNGRYVWHDYSDDTEATNAWLATVRLFGDLGDLTAAHVVAAWRHQYGPK